MESISETTLVHYLCANLPADWQPVVDKVETMSTMLAKDLDISQWQHHLCIEENKRSQGLNGIGSQSNSEKALNVAEKTRSPSSSRFGKKSFSKKGEGSRKFLGNCRYCNKKGHMQKDCWAKERDEKKRSHHEGATSSEIGLIAAEQRRANIPIPIGIPTIISTWILDSGATSHMTSQGQLFNKWRIYQEPKVFNCQYGKW